MGGSATPPYFDKMERDINKTMKQRYYWIKLTENFINSSIYDYIMTLANGSAFMMIYLNLCMLSKNTKGFLYTRINEIVVAWDLEKIQSKLEYFPLDTVRVAFNLFQKLGLVETTASGVFRVISIDDFVGSNKTTSSDDCEPTPGTNPAPGDEPTPPKKDESSKAESGLQNSLLPSYYNAKNQSYLEKILDNYNSLKRIDFAGASKESCDWFINVCSKVSTLPTIDYKGSKLPAFQVLDSFCKLSDKGKNIRVLYKTISFLLNACQGGFDWGINNNFPSIVCEAFRISQKILSDKG